MLDLGYIDADNLRTWLVDLAGNVAATDAGLGILRGVTRLRVPQFASSEEAMEWGSRLNAPQRATLIDMQRALSKAARENGDLQGMVNLATQSQLIREAGEAFAPDPTDAAAKGPAGT